MTREELIEALVESTSIVYDPTFKKYTLAIARAVTRSLANPPPGYSSSTGRVETPSTGGLKVKGGPNYMRVFIRMQPEELAVPFHIEASISHTVRLTGFNMLNLTVYYDPEHYTKALPKTREFSRTRNYQYAVAVKKMLASQKFRADLYDAISHELVHHILDNSPVYGIKQKGTETHAANPAEKRAVIATDPQRVAALNKKKRPPTRWDDLKVMVHKDAHTWRAEDPRTYKKYLKQVHQAHAYPRAERSTFRGIRPVKRVRVSIYDAEAKRIAALDRNAERRAEIKSKIKQIRGDMTPAQQRKAQHHLKWASRTKRQQVIKKLMAKEFQNARNQKRDISRNEALRLALAKYKQTPEYREQVRLDHEDVKRIMRKYAPDAGYPKSDVDDLDPGF
jgi:hypothetical protein